MVKSKIEFIVMTILVCFLGLLTGCDINIFNKKVDTSVYAKIQKNLVELKSYRANTTVKYISNKGVSEYNTYQESKITGEYIIEVLGPENVRGNLTIFDGKTIYQYNPKVKGKIYISSIDTRERTETLLTSFLKNYVLSKDVSVSVSNIKTGKATVLEAIIPGDHPYISSEKLWIDNTTLKPLKLVIYDPKGIERIVVRYNSFDYNIELDSDRFKIN